LGVEVDIRAQTGGALVSKVQPGSPAEKGGLKAGDIVTRINDRLIESSDALVAATRSFDFGETVELEVHSEGSEESRTVEVTLSSE